MDGLDPVESFGSTVFAQADSSNQPAKISIPRPADAPLKVTGWGGVWYTP